MTTMQSPAAASRAPSVHLFTRDEYHQMACASLFDDRRVELLEGKVIDMSPMGTRHAVGTVLAGDVLRQVFGAAFHVRTQMSLGLSPVSEPEPDVAVIPGSPRDFVADHPASAALIVEVADTSLAYDRWEKAAAYAKGGITDYWILNIVDARLEVHRDPQPRPDSPTGFAYASVTFLHPGMSLSPLAAPGAVVPVRDLLPSGE